MPICPLIILSMRTTLQMTKRIAHPQTLAADPITFRPMKMRNTRKKLLRMKIIIPPPNRVDPPNPTMKITTHRPNRVGPTMATLIIIIVHQKHQNLQKYQNTNPSL